MRDNSHDPKSKAMVAKEAVTEITDMDTEMGFVRSSCVASYMAKLFSAKTGKNISFSTTYLFTPNSSSEKVANAVIKIPFCGEAYISGSFSKFTNNADYISSVAGANVLEAFGHYTYSESNKELMVCDLQGVFNPATEAWALTDPQVHSLGTPSQYGRADRGQQGMDEFFSQHTCGEICR